jgi:hypothetical protein
MITRSSTRHFTTLGIALVAALVAAPPAHADSILTDDAFLPAVRIQGATGFYVTDITIFNPDLARKVAVSFYYTPADADGTSSPGFSINPDLFPGETASLGDILGKYFNLSSSYGLLEVKAGAPIIVTSNSYNRAGKVQPGTFGQFSPGQPARNAVGFDNTIYGELNAIGLPNDDNFRTNAVIMNPTNKRLEAGVRLIGPDTFVYGKKVYVVPPYSMTQINDVFYSALAQGNMPASNAYRLNIYVDLGNGAKVLGYVTVTDLRTGDPYLIPAEGLNSCP